MKALTQVEKTAHGLLLLQLQLPSTLIVLTLGTPVANVGSSDTLRQVPVAQPLWVRQTGAPPRQGLVSRSGEHAWQQHFLPGAFCLLPSEVLQLGAIWLPSRLRLAKNLVSMSSAFFQIMCHYWNWGTNFSNCCVNFKILFSFFYHTWSSRYQLKIISASVNMSQTHRFIKYCT